MWNLAKGDPTSPSVQDIGGAIWWPTYVTPYDFLSAQYKCEDPAVFNWSYYCSADLDKLIDDAFKLESTDPKKSEELYAQASQEILDQALSFFIADEKINVVLRSDIKGYVFNPAYLGARMFFYPAHPLTLVRLRIGRGLSPARHFPLGDPRVNRLWLGCCPTLPAAFCGCAGGRLGVRGDLCGVACPTI